MRFTYSGGAGARAKTTATARCGSGTRGRFPSGACSPVLAPGPAAVCDLGPAPPGPARRRASPSRASRRPGSGPVCPGLRVRGRGRLAARALQARPWQRRSGHGPRLVALHPSPQPLRRRGGLVGLLLPRGSGAGFLVDRLQPPPDDAAAHARLGGDAAREEAAGDQAGLPALRGGNERLLPVASPARRRRGNRG